MMVMAPSTMSRSAAWSMAAATTAGWPATGATPASGAEPFRAWMMSTALYTAWRDGSGEANGPFHQPTTVGSAANHRRPKVAS